MRQESPTRPGYLQAVPPVEVAAARFPWASSATAPTVPAEPARSGGPAEALCFSWYQRSTSRAMTNSEGLQSDTPISTANCSAPGPTSSMCSLRSSTSRATWMGLRRRSTAATAPAFRVRPSIRMASSWTQPSRFRWEPTPASNMGSSSSTSTACSQASTAAPPRPRTPRPPPPAPPPPPPPHPRAGARPTPARQAAAASAGISHAPPCTASASLLNGISGPRSAGGADAGQDAPGGGLPPGENNAVDDGDSRKQGDGPQRRPHAVEDAADDEQHHALGPLHEAHLAGGDQRLGPRSRVAHHERTRHGHRRQHYVDEAADAGVVDQQAHVEHHVGVAVDHRVEEGPEGAPPPLLARPRPVGQIEDAGEEDDARAQQEIALRVLRVGHPEDDRGAAVHQQSDEGQRVRVNAGGGQPVHDLAVEPAAAVGDDARVHGVSRTRPPRGGSRPYSS